MSLLGSIFKSVLPVAASFIPGIGPIAGPALGAILNAGGGGSGANSALSGSLAGLATAQRIPGQTQAGEYTPPAGGFGTYNYIPTGATQIDPALIQMILNSGITNTNTAGYGGDINYMLSQQGLNNLYAGSMMNGLSDAANYSTQLGTMLRDQLPALWQGANDVSGQARDLIGQMAGYTPDLWQGGINTSYALGNLLKGAQDNPYAASTIANSANIGQGMQTAGAGLAGTAADYLGGVQGQVNSLLNNPYLQQAQAGANTAGGMMQNTGLSGYNQGQTYSNAALSGLPAIQQTLATAFDPQQDLYNRTARQTQDQLGVFLANSGLTNSGAGAQIMGDALRDFNINWQNAQQNRQNAGLNAYTNAMTSLGGNLGTGQNLQTSGAGTYASGAALPGQTFQNIGSNQLQNLGALGSALGTAGNVLSSGQQMQMQGANAGNNAYNANLQNQLGYANAYGDSISQLGQLSGQIGQNMGNAIAGYGNAQSGLRSANSQIGNTAGQVSNLYQTGATLPYTGQQQIYGNQNQALANYLNNQTGMSNLTNQNIVQLQNYLAAVMNGAGNASNAASGAQTNTMNQNASAAAGIQPLVQSGLNGLGNLFTNLFDRNGNGTMWA